jgi:parallel beta-helix repeat protein
MDVVANIDENIIIKNEYGIQQLTVASAIISGNIIEENKYGIYSLKKSVLNVHINSINKNEYGIFSWERTQGLVSNNNIAKNSYGIYCGKSSHLEIKGNKIIQNKTGILCEYSSYPKINGNNIYDQKKYDIKLGENQSAEWTRNIWDEAEIKKWEETGRFGLIDATGNFWGVSTTKEMDKKGFGLHIKMIYDHYKDQFCRVKEKDYARDKVDFRNWEHNEIN